ncbi:MAG: FISUMP domain-containing protein, partial [Bacteroidota bacterium]
SINATANPVCGGDSVTFTAFPINPGTNPSYQWKVNATNAGMNNVVFIYSPGNGDSVTCTLTSSEPCTSGNPASSNPIIMIVVEAPEVTFTPCFDTITTTNAKPIKLKGGIPLNGTYSGPGVNSATGIWDPSSAGVGNQTITYTYTNAALCTASAWQVFRVVAAPAVTCGDSFTDVRDNQVYPTLQIGSQCWFAANLNYGTEIPITTPQRDNCITEKYVGSAFSVPVSAFYQWEELMKYEDTEEIQGLCPPEWHIPSENEWNTLFASWTNNAFAGAPLKYTGYSGFNAFLNGTGFFNQGWWFGDFAAFFWSSTSHGPWKAWAHGMNEVDFSVSYYPSYRANAFAVRCLRD